MGHRAAEVALGLFTLGFAGTALACEPPRPVTLRVLVLNQAHISLDVLHEAEDDASAIFTTAGVDLVWLDRTTSPHQPFDVTVKIATGMTPAMLPREVTDTTLGFAAVNRGAEGRRGRLVWVLFDQVETHAERRHVRIGLLSGLVMAHEIGHLLLPAGHSETGLMRATWDLRAGVLEYFDERQAREIHDRLISSQLR